MSTSSAPVPKVSRAPRFPLVWVVPVIALALGGWMVARELKNRGPEITIEFADGSGVVAEKTLLEHKGVSVGRVIGVELKPGLEGVNVRVRHQVLIAHVVRLHVADVMSLPAPQISRRARPTLSAAVAATWMLLPVHTEPFGVVMATVGAMVSELLDPPDPVEVV